MPCPAIERDLGASQADLQWVVTGYTLTLGAFLLVGGRTATVGWPWCFFIVVPIGLMAAGFAPSTIAEIRDASAPRLDLLGQLLWRRVSVPWRSGFVAVSTVATVIAFSVSSPTTDRGIHGCYYLGHHHGKALHRIRLHASTSAGPV